MKVMRRLLALVAVTGAVAVIAPVSASARPQGGSGPRALSPDWRWLTSLSEPANLYQHGAPNTWHATWAIMSPGVTCDQVPPGAQPAFWFADYDKLANAVNTGELAGTPGTPGDPSSCKPRFTAVVVDYESWSATPPGQQAQWQTYMAMAYNLAHANGLTVIEAPAADVDGGWTQWLNDKGPQIAARYGDVLDVQAQTYEVPSGDQPRIFYFDVSTSVTQAHAGHPGIPVIVGLRGGGCGTDPQVSSDDTTNAWDEVAGLVVGAWLNADCYPETFVPLLNNLYPPTS